eukprot:6212542-Pleurochrysis_carterae.AAC.1
MQRIKYHIWTKSYGEDGSDDVLRADLSFHTFVLETSREVFSQHAAVETPSLKMLLRVGGSGEHAPSRP